MRVPAVSGRVAERFWAKVTVTDDQDCWLWEGTTRNGYGQFVVHHTLERGRVIEQVHRMVLLLCGRDPRGLEVHHLCHKKLCVNPSHLKLLERSAHHREHGGWTKEELIGAIQEFASMFGVPPAATDWNPSAALAMGHHDRAERFYQHGWPSFATVQKHFGSWGEGLEAAGFKSKRGRRKKALALPRVVASSDGTTIGAASNKETQMACGGCAKRKAEREARAAAKAEKAAQAAAQQQSVQASVSQGK